MIVLITNDDGIEAEGLQVLNRVVSRSLPAAEVYIVAPAAPMSMVGHRVTTHELIPFEQRGERKWALGGTPADCVRAALFALLPQRVDWVFSGINHGGNLGQDIFISGTLAAAREAAYHGVPAVGFSHYLLRGREVDWERAERWACQSLGQIVALDHRDGQYWNVNLPHLNPDDPEPELLMTRPERGALPVCFGREENGLRYAGIYTERPRSPGTDVAACFAGQVSISSLRIHE
jgi:5'-nucleotidase